MAAIDCGTNTTRLLVARAGDDGRLEILERTMLITRLGAGVAAAGRLDPEAVERTMAALRRFRASMDSHGVERARVIATSAARDAADVEAFLAAAGQVVGVRPELLEGEEEGRLAFRGATLDLDPAGGPYMVVDIGGGSTEFAVGRDEPEGVMSVDVGSVRLTETYVHHDPPQPEELSACISVTQAYLEDVVRELPSVLDIRQVVGVAGTVSTVAAVEIGLAVYDRDALHHFRLSRAAAEDVFHTLATEPRADRVHNPGLDPGRADVIVAGCCVLVAVLRHFDLDEVLVSESDILEGLASTLV